MRDSWKVASWELKKNLMNKSFIISIFITPIIFLVFALLPNLFSDLDSSETTTIYAIDELQVVEQVNRHLQQMNSTIQLVLFSGAEEVLRKQIEAQDNQGYIKLDSDLLQSKQMNVYVGGESTPSLQELYSVLTQVLDIQVLQSSGAAPEVVQYMATPFSYQTISVIKGEDTDLSKIIPGIIAGVILFGITITGMMPFQSAMQEKKDKVSEILLSSITANQLMQGKIIGYFILGIFQIGVWLSFGIPAASIYFDVALLSYLLNGEFLLLIFYALGGYLLFSAIFVALGATMDDINTSSNFQGIIFMLPFLPFLFIAPVLANPNGMIASVGSFIPLTAPGVMVLRLSVAQQVPLIEVVLSIVLLVASIWVTMKIAGKIFKTGIMMYGKNATPGEIWKWIRQ